MIVEGAGVDPAKVIRPSKRIKAWHRGTLAAGGQFSLKQIARIPFADAARQSIARRWLASKGARP